MAPASRPRPVVLIILDGWGLAEPSDGNAVHLAQTPNMDELLARYPSCRLEASGESVGLLPGQMGNSNVGHLNLGAGHIVYQDLLRISKSIWENSFFRNDALVSAIKKSKQDGAALHLMGLVSDGGVHSHIDHLFALLEMSKMFEVPTVFIHCFLDGRDVPPACAGQYIERLELEIMSKYQFARIGTLMGRYYAMDRDKRWDRTKRAYDAIVLGKGLRARTAMEGLREAYGRGETDEFVVPTVIGDYGVSVRAVEPGDSIIFFNFRADRARQITRAFIEREFYEFPREKGYIPVLFTSMTQYDELFDIPCAFPPDYLKNTFGEVISRAGMRQLRIAETEKYAHVTYFFSGGEEQPFPGEDRTLIPSPKVPTYDLKPEMSAYGVTEAVIQQIASNKYDVIIMNYANPDMVGHTGVMSAAVRAIEVVDECLGRVVKAVRDAGGVSLVLSDHGNAEEMIDKETGQPHTAHTCNPVPCILVDDQRLFVKLADGLLANVAPTLLDIMGLDKPAEMTEYSLIRGS